MADYYDILGVSRNATQPEITAAYKAAVKKYHPDRHQGNDLQELAQERLKALNEAYETLSDPRRRVWYDRGEKLAGMPGQNGPGISPNAFSGLGKRIIGLAAVAIAVPVIVRLATNPKGLMVILAVGGLWWLSRKLRRRK